MVSVANKEYISSRVSESGTGFKDMEYNTYFVIKYLSGPLWKEKKGKTGNTIHSIEYICVHFYRSLQYLCFFKTG